MSLKQEVLKLAESQFADIVRIRRDIHMNPEFGFEVQRTAGIAAAEMKKLGLDVKEKIGKSGVIADLIVNPSFPLVALRADMDALPMQEESDPVYKSKVPGIAHMCGHDAHTAMLIGAARIISELKTHLKVNVRFLFQPNEENLPGGAPEMIKDGALKGVREIYGLHVWPLVPVGKVASIAGPLTAQPDIFTVTIKGRGGHAAMPHMSIDPINIGTQFVSQLQTIVSRNVDPMKNAVLSVTQFHSGSTHNVIPEKVFIQGTVRNFDSDTQKDIKARIERTLKAICQAHEAEYEWDYLEGYPVLLNDAKLSTKVNETIADLLGPEKVGSGSPIMGGEDFAFYTQKIPGCFYMLGIRNEAKGITKMCHDPRFDIDEDALTIGMAMHASLVLSLN